mgnify:CR=1 FL=1
MTKNAKLLLILSIISAIILWILMGANPQVTENIIDKILFFGSIIFVGGWILSFVLGIFLKALPESKPAKIRKTKTKTKKKNEDITPLQFIIFYPIATFSFIVLLGLISSGFQP